MTERDPSGGDGLVADGHVPVVGRNDAAHGPPEKHRLQIAVGAVPRSLDHVAQWSPELDLHQAGPGEAGVQGQDLRAGTGICPEASVGLRTTTEDDPSVHQCFDIVDDSGRTVQPIGGRIRGA